MAQISFFIRLVSLIMIFFSLTQTESAILIVAVLAVLLPWLQTSFAPFLYGLKTKKTYDTLLLRSPSGKIDMEGYIREGIELTEAGVDDLISFYERNPGELQKLSVRARMRTERLLEKKRRQRRQH